MLEVTDEARALSDVLLSGKFHHGDDMKAVSLKPDPRMAEIPAIDREIQIVLDILQAWSSEDSKVTEQRI